MNSVLSLTSRIKSLFTQILFLLFIALFIPCTIYAQAAKEPFGKNRIQHGALKWKFLSGSTFDVYYYEGGEGYGKQALEIAETEFRRISELLGFSPYSKIKIFVYTSTASVIQSNVGLGVDNPALGKVNTFAKSIVEIGYPGSYLGFKQAIVKGITQTLVYDMLYGGSLQDMLRNSYFLSLPDWFIDGVANYAAFGWDAQADDRLRDLMLNRNLRNPSRLKGEEAALVGQSIWNFIALKYGQGNISNILNFTRIIRSEESSIGSTLGTNYRYFLRDWRYYYESQALKVGQTTNKPDPNQRIGVANAKGNVICHLALSPDSKYLSFVEHRNGRYKLYTLDLETKTTKVINSGGDKWHKSNPDYLNPLPQWQNNNTLAFISRKKNKLYYKRNNVTNGYIQRSYIDEVNQISSMSFSPDGKLAVLSADALGQNDLYLLDTRKGSFTQITNTKSDDFHPVFSTKGKGIFFVSNQKPDTTKPQIKPTNNFNLYVAYQDEERKISIEKLYSSAYNITKPIPLNDSLLLFLSDSNGVNNIYLFNIKQPQKVFSITNFRQSVTDYVYDAVRNRIYWLMSLDGRSQLNYMVMPDVNQDFVAEFTPRTPMRILEQQANNSPIIDNSVRTNPAQKPEIVRERKTNNAGQNQLLRRAMADSSKFFSDEIDVYDYVFEAEKRAARDALNAQKAAIDAAKIIKPKIKPPSTDSVVLMPNQLNLAIVSSSKIKEVKITTPEVVDFKGPYPYMPRSSIDGVNTHLVVDPIRSWGMAAEGSLSDMFEDHLFNFGATIYADLASYDAFTQYNYLKNRVDFGGEFRRKSIFINQQTTGLTHKYILDQVEATISYPFNINTRISISPRFMRTSFQDMTFVNQGYEAVNVEQNYWGGKAEFVFDNTIVKGKNIIEGTRFKVKFQHNHGISKTLRSFGSVDADFRNYQNIWRGLTFATRLAGGAFFGAAPKSYILGGMDNWLFYSVRETDSDNDPLNLTVNDFLDDGKTDWLFTPFVTNMRGFPYNTLFGNNYVLINNEIRWPLARFLYNGPIESSFLRNFSLSVFNDIGSAWTGASPFASNNYNTSIQEGGNFEITIRNYRQPVLIGYGWGVRTEILGTYLKGDMAWGLQDGEVGNPWYYVTFGFDF